MADEKPKSIDVQIAEIHSAIKSLAEQVDKASKFGGGCAECSCGPCFECGSCRVCRICYHCYHCLACICKVCAECSCGPCAQGGGFGG